MIYMLPVLFGSNKVAIVEYFMLERADGLGRVDSEDKNKTCRSNARCRRHVVPLASRKLKPLGDCTLIPRLSRQKQAITS
jgi:hypothetical protein